MTFTSIALTICLQVQDDPYAVMKKMREGIAAAKSMKVVAEAEFCGGKAAIDLCAKGGKFCLRLTPDPSTMKGALALTCDGRAVVIESHGQSSTARSEEFPSHLRTGFAVPLYASAMPGAHTAWGLDPKAEFLRSAGREKVGDRECIKIEWLYESGNRGLAGTTWIDAERFLPVKLAAWWDGRDQAPIVVETYTLTLNATIDDSVFALQSKSRLTRALAQQLGAWIEAHQQFNGVPPRDLDALGRVPKDAWERAFAFAGGEVVSLGEDGRVGGEGESGDIRVDVAPPGGTAIRPTTDRLKEYYAARLQMRQVTAAIEAFRFAYRALPPKLDDLVKRPASVEFWPEGGFLAAVPEKLVYAAGAVRRPDLPRLTPGDLTAEERAALEKSAPVPLTKAEREEIDKLLGFLAADEVESRDTAARALIRVGARVAPILEEAAKGKEGDLAMRLKDIRAKVAMPRPSWEAELGRMRAAAKQTGAKVDRACQNNLLQLWKMQLNYSFQFGGRARLMPSQTGPDFRLHLSTMTPPLIDSTLRSIFLCSGSGETDDACRYWGPAEAVETYGAQEAVGMCDDPAHGESVVLLFKTGEVRLVGRKEEAYQNAVKKLKPRDE